MYYAIRQSVSGVLITARKVKEVKKVEKEPEIDETNEEESTPEVIVEKVNTDK